MTNKISIIIPAYNIQDYLGKTLETVIAQTYLNIEIIIINDGSTDQTGTIADTYANKDPRIKVIHKENGGVSSARLAGIAQATGEWIGFVDGDDEAEPDMFSRLLENAVQYSADISICGHQMIFPDGHIDYYYNTGKLMQFDHERGLYELISGATIEPGLWNKIFRAELFRDIEKMDLSLRYNEDLLMNYYLFCNAGSSVYEDFCPYRYLLRPGSATTSAVSGAKLEDPIRVTRIIQQAATHQPYLASLVLRRLVHQLIQGSTMSARPNKALLLPFRKKCRAELWALLPQTKVLSLPLRLQACWAALSPKSYAFVHLIYSVIKGTHNIYKID